MSEKKIELLKPVEWHHQEVKTIELREPTGAHYRKFGEPRIVVHNSSGGGYFVEQPDVIDRYLDAIIVHEGGKDLMSLLGLADVMQVKQALFDFFEAAEAKILAQKLTRSSSARNVSTSTLRKQ